MAKGPYVPLSVGYRESDRMLGVEPLAELLFVRSLAFAKEKFLDGFIRNRQAAVLAHDLEATYGAHVDTLVGQLVRVGLWCEVVGGWVIEGWDDWNTLDASLAGTLGNHERWHVRRGVIEADCPHCDRPESGASRPDIAPHRVATDATVGSIAINTDQCNTDQCTSEGAAKAAPATKPRKRRTTLPDDFAVTDDLRAWAAAKSFPFDLDRETEQFLEHHRAKGTLMLDWRAAWRKWMGKSAEYAAERPRSSNGREPNIWISPHGHPVVQ
jgi:hypothetical protein